MVANQLDIGDGTNGISQVLASGLVSDPAGNNNTELYLWNPNTQQYQTLFYWNATDAASFWGGTAGFYDGGGTYYNSPLKPGAAAFLFNFNNTSSNLNVTFVGTVPQTTNIYTIIPGYNLVGLTAPVVTNLVGSLANYTGVSDPDGNNNDQLYLWNSITQQYQTLFYWNATDAASFWGGAAGFYDGGGTFYNVAPNVGQGFFINRVINQTTTWTNIFNFSN